MERIGYHHLPQHNTCYAGDEMNPPVVMIIPDLFFAVKVQAAAKRAGLPLVAASSAATGMDLLRKGASLLVVDLNCRDLDTVQLIRDVKKDPSLRAIPVLGFVSHVQTDRKREAINAGCDTVVARSVFSDRTAELLTQAVSRDRHELLSEKIV
jgi:CheY-like chemotaxis protein